MHGEAKCCKGREGSLTKCADLETIITEAKPRSKTWLSTCYALDDGCADAGMCGVGYQVSPPSTCFCIHIHKLSEPYRLTGRCTEPRQAHLWHEHS